MKGFVLRFKRNNKTVRLPDLGAQRDRLRRAVSKHGLKTVFASLFVLGAAVGAASSDCFGDDTLGRLDLLFVSNISARMSMSVFDIFVSCFVSYFLFIFCVFIAGLSVWGFAAVPVISAFRGFTAGLSAAFVFSAYKTSGIGFYILVILPGTLLFLFALIRYCASGFNMSMRFARISLFGYDREPELRLRIREYMKRTLTAFFVSVVCAVTDMTLWILFAGKFDF